MDIWLILAGGAMLAGGWIAWWFTFGRFLLDLQRRFIGTYVGVALRGFRLYRPWQAWLGRRLGYDISGTAKVEDFLRLEPSRLGQIVGAAGFVLTFLGLSVILEGIRGRGFMGLTIFN
ncbi:hypothetical protein [Inquilinus limosus]|uniref:Uncharacterized protein n=1 Tax=Inquilinus limosus TaxID=171674 RepID=A0A211ZI13_9PROT|nr:hypothetical protein [Inquilinus limosus]OWJ64880.1 hypothetical protein BWR60_22230 [Inquilinus limosus]